MILRLAIVLSLASLCLAGCAAPSGDEGAASSEEALSALPTGHYAVTRAPSRGSYVSSITLSAGKKFELEYVRVRETTEPWVFNPWIPVPARKEEKISVKGTYFLYEAHGQRVSFEGADVGAPDIDVEIAIDGGRLSFSPIEGQAYTLERAAQPPADTSSFVASCKARFWEGTLRLDQNGRRRGTLRADKRLPGADNATPNVGSFAIAYTGSTGVEDYMGFEGKDSGNNEVSFALKKSVLENSRAGSSFSIGLSYSRDLAGYGVHQTLDCKVE